MTTRPLFAAPSRAAIDLGACTRGLPQALVAAAAVELLLLRLFTRTAIHIPGIDQFAGSYSVLAETGRLAYYAATALLVVLLASVALRALAARSLAGALAALGIGLFLVGAAAALAGSIDDLALAAITLAAVVALVPFAAIALGPRGAVGLLLFVGAFALTVAFRAIEMAGGHAPSALLPAAESLALLFALSAPLLFVREGRNRRRLILAASLGALVFLALLANPATVKILALWSFGLAGYFPAVVYGAAVGALLYAVLMAVHRGRWSVALGLALLVLGGIGLQSTYQSGLVIAGLGLLAGVPFGRQPASAARLAWVQS